MSEHCSWEKFESQYNFQETQEALNKLQARCENNTGNFEQDENWDYFAMIEWIKLNLALSSPTDLVKILSKAHEVLSIAQKEWQLENKFYSEESSWTQWEANINSEMNLYIDNRIIWDTTMFSEKWFRTATWINPSRNNNTMQAFADFLNQIVENRDINKYKQSYKEEMYANN